MSPASPTEPLVVGAFCMAHGLQLPADAFERELVMRMKWVALGVVVGAAALCAGERQAKACGGCFHPPEPPGEDPSMVTAHRMILSVSSKQTTLYDQIKYSGSPKDFAWVLPISGLATV